MGCSPNAVRTQPLAAGPTAFPALDMEVTRPVVAPSLGLILHTLTGPISSVRLQAARRLPTSSHSTSAGRIPLLTPRSPQPPQRPSGPLRSFSSLSAPARCLL